VKIDREIKKQPAKRAYQKPRLRVIELKADEVLSTGCKTPTSKPQGFPPGIEDSCSLVLCASPDGS
jgi:hypothetical protein